MGRLTPIVLPGENEEIELKVKPRVCEMCGGKYIPHGPRQKYCPACRQAMGKEKKGAKTKIERDMEHAFGKKEGSDPFEAVTVTVTPEEISEEVAEQVTIAEEPKDRPQIIKGLASLLGEQLGVEVLPFEEVEDVEIYVGTNRIFRGYAIGRSEA